MAGKAVVINSSTGTGASVSFTSSGFGTPTGAIIFWSAATSSNADTDGARSAVTVWAGSNTGSVGGISQDNTSKTTSRSITYSSLRQNSPSSPANADFVGTVSTTTDGITISFSDSPDADYKVTVILFGGDAVCSAAATDYGSLTTGGTYSYTGASATPDVVFISASGSSTVNSDSARAFFNLGFAVNDGAASQRCFLWNEVGNQNDSVIELIARNNAIVSNNDGTNYLQLSAFTESGFTLTSVNATNLTGIVLTISGLSDFSLNDTAMPASTGTTSFTGPGFAPDLVLSVQSGLPAYNTFYNTQNLNLTIGASDGTTTGGVAVYGTDGAATTDTANRHNTTLGTSDQTTAAEQWNYTLDSFDADGYNFNYTEVGTSGDIGFTLAIQFESAVTPITGYWAMDGVFEL